MIQARFTLIGHPVLFRLLLRRTQSNVGFIRADVHPAASVATLAFATHPEFRKRSLKESDHLINVAHSEIRMFEPNSHRPPPKVFWRPRQSRHDKPEWRVNSRKVGTNRTLLGYAATSFAVPKAQCTHASPRHQELRSCLLWRWRKRRRNIVRRHSTDDAPSLFGLHPCMSETRGAGAFIRTCAISTVNGCAKQSDNNISAEFSDRQRLHSVVQYLTFRHKPSNVVFMNRVVLEAGPTDKPIIPEV